MNKRSKHLRKFVIFTKPNRYVIRDDYQVWKRRGVNLVFLEGNSTPILTCEEHGEVRAAGWENCDYVHEQFVKESHTRNAKTFPEYMCFKGYTMRWVTEAKLEKFKLSLVGDEFLRML